MISVLIPIFNYNVTRLVTTIHSQLLASAFDFEIICIDDASTNYCFENDKLLKLKNVKIHKLSSNVGRSKIRNLLAEKATHDWLLFLDADVLPKNDNFIETYLNSIKLKKENVFCGGITYQNKKPVKEKMLRWVYGKNREEVNVKIRKENPYRYFFGANFLIHKSIFKTCKFNEAIVQYGFEDVLFITDLKKHKIKISHLKNLVFHLGIELSEVFLAKTKQAVENLHDINSQKWLEGNDLKLLKIFEKLKAYKVIGVLGETFFLFDRLFEYNLKSSFPSMFVLDLYKLTYFCYLFNKKPILNC